MKLASVLLLVIASLVACQKDEISLITKEGVSTPKSWISYKVNGEEIFLSEEVEAFSLDGFFRLTGTASEKSEMLSIDITYFKEWQKEYEIQSMLVETYYNNLLTMPEALNPTEEQAKSSLRNLKRIMQKELLNLLQVCLKTNYLVLWNLSL